LAWVNRKAINLSQPNFGGVATVKHWKYYIALSNKRTMYRILGKTMQYNCPIWGWLTIKNSDTVKYFKWALKKGIYSEK
jgi:hypothetical protein